ncbi:MAG: Gfo/Idh/MocA family oxidoreductase [Bryobacteraceae bacterium]
MPNNNRREFIRNATRVASTSAVAMTAASYSRVLGANDKVQMGVIGVGDRGRHVMSLFMTNSDVQVSAVCDVYAQQIDLAKQKATAAASFSDYRKLLEMNELDVVLIATPDHWHATCAIAALNAGKDVYVEKPLTRTPEEGPPIVKAARVNNRVCQVGMQQRSGKHYLQAKKEYFDTGKLGQITLARTWWYGNGYHLRKAPESLQTKPSNLDWAQFLGPVKWRDYDPQQYYNWRAYLDFGGGQVTDLFTHWIDVVHMFMGKDIPIAAVGVGGVFAYPDGRTAPDTINVLLEYPGPKQFTATFEATLVPGITGAALEIAGTQGRLYIDRNRFNFYPKGVKEPITVEGYAAPDRADLLTQDHVNNFLECVKTRERPNGDVLIGHRSAQASHLGNISYVQKRRIDFDPTREEILPL